MAERKGLLDPTFLANARAARAAADDLGAQLAQLEMELELADLGFDEAALHAHVNRVLDSAAVARDAIARVAKARRTRAR